MNKDRGNESKESTPRSEEEDKSGRQLKSLSQFEGPESWSNAESSVGSSARKRPSSWDDSDGESPSTTINSLNHNGLIYSGRSQKREKSVAEEINDIKTQYFKDLEGVEGLSEPPNFIFEAKTCKNVEDEEEIRSKLDASDRRQSPARIRRRTKSSSSSSAVLEHTVECSSFEYKEDFQIFTPENYQYKASKYQSYSSENPSVKAELELDSSFFLDHIFTELRTKRIGLVSLGEESSFGKRSRDGEILDLESCSGSNMKLLTSHDLARTFPSHKYNPDLKTLESFESEEPITFIHKTSRKLSQILEVEETKKSQEGINLSEEEAGVQLFEMSPFLWANTQKSPDDVMSPFPTSNDGEENMPCWTSIISLRQKPETLALETAQLSPKNSGSLDKLREEEKPENSQGRPSKRFDNLFPYSDSDNDNIIFLTEKTGKTQLGLNSEKQDDNNFGLFEDYENVKDVDGIQRQTSWQILEMENVNSESEKVDVGGNSGSRGTNNDSGTPQKNSRCVKTSNSEIGENCQERTPNVSEETLLSWSESSTPRHSSRKSSKRERESDFLLEMECSNSQSQRLTSRGLQIEVTPGHSSRESSFRLKDEYVKSTSGETSRGSTQRTRHSFNPETAEDKPNCLIIDLERIYSDSSTSTGSNSSSYRTFTQDEIKDPSFRTNSPGQSARSSHTSELSKTESSKKMKNYFSDCLDPNRLKMKGSKTDRDFKPQKISSRSLRSSDVIFGNLERKTESTVDGALIIREKETSANSEGRLTTATIKEPSKRNETRPVSINNTDSCDSVVSEGTEVRHAELNDVIANLEGTRISRQMENHGFCGNVTMTVGNITSEKINSSRSDKTGTKWSNNKSFDRNKEEEEVRKGLCQTRSEETVKSEDFIRNLMSVQSKDVIQEYPESFKKNDETVRNTVTSGQFSEDVMIIEESETFLGEKSSLSPSSAGAIDKELTIPIEDISSSLEKIDINSDKSDRENERAKTEADEESCRSRRGGKLSNESLFITCENWKENTLKVNLSPGKRSNRTAISSASSGAAEKDLSSNISEAGSCRYSRPEGSQILSKKLKSTSPSSKTSFQESLGHETPKEPKEASKPTFQEKFNGETWNRLIDAFEGADKSERSSENKFPGFPSLNQKRFTERDREETQDFFMYEPDEIEESEDFFTFSRRLIEAEWKSCLRSPKGREQKGNKCENLVPESVSVPLEHPEGRVIFKGNEEESAYEHDSKIRSFEIGEFGDGNCWNDGKHDISEPEKPQHHGDGNQERRNNWETLVLRLEDNKKENEMKGRSSTCMDFEGKGPRPNLPKNKSFSGKENNADLEPIFHSHNLSHSKSDNSLSKMWSPLRANESESLKTWTTTAPIKETTRREVSEDPDCNSRIGDCREQSFYEEREYQFERSYSDDENRLINEENLEKSFEILNTVSSEMDNRKQVKEYTNLSIFLAGQKKEKALVKTNNWLVIKNQEGKQSKQQKEKIRKLKKKLKKCDKLNSSKEPLYVDENATGRMPAFVPVLKFGNTSCLQNFYKRLFSICCLTSNSSAATSV